MRWSAPSMPDRTSATRLCPCRNSGESRPQISRCRIHGRHRTAHTICSMPRLAVRRLPASPTHPTARNTGTSSVLPRVQTATQPASGSGSPRGTRTLPGVRAGSATGGRLGQRGTDLANRCAQPVQHLADPKLLRLDLADAVAEEVVDVADLLPPL